MATVKAKKDLYNSGKCFTKGREYEIEGNVYNQASLMDLATINDQGDRHIIGSWWRDFKIVKP